jgi:hypothetical protein
MAMRTKRVIMPMMYDEALLLLDGRLPSRDTEAYRTGRSSPRSPALDWCETAARRIILLPYQSYRNECKEPPCCRCKKMKFENRDVVAVELSAVTSSPFLPQAAQYFVSFVHHEVPGSTDGPRLSLRHYYSCTSIPTIIPCRRTWPVVCLMILE